MSPEINIFLIIFNFTVLNFFIFLLIKLANYYKINDLPNFRSLHKMGIKKVYTPKDFDLNKIIMDISVIVKEANA